MSGSTQREVARSRPRAGRPRDPSVDDRVLQAAREELAERGVAGFSMRSVAQRAGVARPSLLLRWPEADTLIVNAIDSIVLPKAPDLPGTLREDLAVVLGVVAEQMGSDMMDLQMRVMADAHAHPTLLARYQERLHRPTARLFDEVLLAAVNRGELSADVDRRLLQDCLTGVVYIRTMASPQRRPPGAKARQALIDKILRAATRP